MANYITPATLLCDFYKVSHREQYPKNTEFVYSTWTPRQTRIEGIDEVVAFGFQSFIKEYLIDYFNKNFFDRNLDDVIAEYVRVIKHTLGIVNPDYSHIEDLWHLGFLPIKIKAVKEGTLIPIKVPMLTVENTHPDFFWLTNYLETIMSNELWLPTNSATIAFEYRKILQRYAIQTGGDISGVPFQAHDFSMRGMASLTASKASGAGHLLSFTGTDSIPAICFLEEYYNANIEKELVGASIPATEHSVMSAHNGATSEFEAYKQLVTKIYPNGFFSVVSDTYDLWNVITNYLPRLKDEIMARDGKMVIRPDSGDPVKIICGDPESDNENARKGVIELLWEIFGGTTTEKGYKQLDPHIGAIYGDSITLAKCEEICFKLMEKGFASTNMVFGVGSYTYQYNTRDTFGFAMKATHVVIDGVEHNIFKDPATDTGKFKKSQTGRVVVVDVVDEGIQYVDHLSIQAQEDSAHVDELETVFENGELVRAESLSEIRERLLSNL